MLIKIHHEGNIFFINDKIILNPEGAKELVKLIKEDKEKLISILLSRTALIEKTSGNIWSQP